MEAEYVLNCKMAAACIIIMFLMNFCKIMNIVVKIISNRIVSKIDVYSLRLNQVLETIPLAIHLCKFLFPSGYSANSFAISAFKSFTCSSRARRLLLRSIRKNVGTL